MSTIYGADIAQLRALAAQFDVAADRLEGSLRTTGALVQTSAWSGPDAGRFRQEWVTIHERRLSQVAMQIRDAAQRLRTNADAQERTSAADGGWDVTNLPHIVLPSVFPPLPDRVFPAMPNPIAPSSPDRIDGADPGWRDSLDWIERFKDQGFGDTGWSRGDLLGLVPMLGTSLDLLGGADKLSHGELPWHEACDIVGGALRGNSSMNPVLYGVGLNVSLWADVAEAAANPEIDWSGKGMQDAFNGLFNADAWKEVGHDLMTKLPPIIAGDFGI